MIFSGSVVTIVGELVRSTEVHTSRRSRQRPSRMQLLMTVLLWWVHDMMWSPKGSMIFLHLQRWVPWMRGRRNFRQRAMVKSLFVRRLEDWRRLMSRRAAEERGSRISGSW